MGNEPISCILGCWPPSGAGLVCILCKWLGPSLSLQITWQLANNVAFNGLKPWISRHRYDLGIFLQDYMLFMISSDLFRCQVPSFKMDIPKRPCVNWSYNIHHDWHTGRGCWQYHQVILLADSSNLWGICLIWYSFHLSNVSWQFLSNHRKWLYVFETCSYIYMLFCVSRIGLMYWNLVMHIWTGAALVGLMASCLFSTKPLPESLFY